MSHPLCYVRNQKNKHFTVMSEQSSSATLPQPSADRPPTAESPPDQPGITSIRPALDLLNCLDFHCPSNPPNILSVLRLYCIHGMTIPEIARRCRCSVGTVCNRLKLFRNVTGHSPEHFRRPDHPRRGRPKLQI
jgi:DNA-directed RNA polymerase specialized sigma24 family protein